MGDAPRLGSTANPQGRLYEGVYGEEIYMEGVKKKKKKADSFSSVALQFLTSMGVLTQSELPFPEVVSFPQAI